MSSFFVPSSNIKIHFRPDFQHTLFFLPDIIINLFTTRKYRKFTNIYINIREFINYLNDENSENGILFITLSIIFPVYLNEIKCNIL